MLKLYLLTFLKIKKLLLVLLILTPLVVIGYFIYKELIDKTNLNDNVVSIKYSYKEPYAKNNKINKVSLSKFFNDRNANLIYARCSINDNNLLNLDFYYCSIISKNYEDKNEVAIMQFAFNDVTEFFGECIYKNLDESKYPNSSICNYDDYENNKLKWFENKVLLKSIDFVIDVYKTLKFGPEMQLLNLITITRGANSLDINIENKTLNSFGSYDSNEIKIYISNASSTTFINKDYFEAITHLNSQKQSLFVSSFDSLKQLIIEFYGLHIVQFNKYKGRNTRFDYTIDKTNQLFFIFKGIINIIKEGFADDDINKYDLFSELFTLANKQKTSISNDERNRAIEIFQSIVLKDSSFEVNLDTLISIDKYNYYFQNCDSNKKYKYRLYNTPLVITNDSKNRDKEEMFLWIRNIFDWKTILNNLYLILTSYTPEQPLSICPNLYDTKYNFLNYYLAFKIFGLDVHKSISFSKKLSNLVFYNIFYKVNAFSQVNNKNFGIIITQNEDEETILDSPPFVRVSKIKKISYFTQNNYKYNKLFFVYEDNNLLNNNDENNRYSIFVGSDKRGAEILPFNWSNIGYKRTFFSKIDSEFLFLNNSIGGYIAEFTINKKEKRKNFDEDRHFIFHDVDTPNFYYIGEKQIDLDVLPIYDEDDTPLWQQNN